MRCGQIVLLDYPFTDSTGSKVRPALVVSNDEYNRGDDVVVVPISSVPDPNDAHALHLPQSDSHFRATGLRQDSSVKWTKPSTLAKRIIRRQLGDLSAPLLAEVQSRIRGLFQD